MYGVMDVRADSLKDAVKKAYEGDMPLPMNNSAYVEASFEVDEDVVEDFNPENCL